MEASAPVVKSKKHAIIATNGNNLRVSSVHFDKHRVSCCITSFAPAVKSAQNDVTAAHGNSLRVRHLLC